MKIKGSLIKKEPRNKLRKLLIIYLDEYIYWVLFYMFDLLLTCLENSHLQEQTPWF